MDIFAPMTRIVLFLTIAFVITTVQAQTPAIDSLRHLPSTTTNIERKVDLLNQLSNLNLAYSIDSMESYANRALELAKEIGYDRGEIEANKNLGVALYSKGMYSVGFRHFYDALRLSEQSRDTLLLAKVLHNLGGAYFYQGNYAQALKYVSRAKEEFLSVDDSLGAATSLLSMCECYQRLNKPDSAIFQCEEALKVLQAAGQEERLAHAYHYMAEAYISMNDLETANEYFWRSMRLVTEGSYWSVGAYVFKDYGNYQLLKSNFDSASYYLHQSLAVLQVYDSKDALKETLKSLSAMHELLDNYDSALFYLKGYSQIIGPDFNKERDDQLASIEAHYNLELQQRELLLTQSEVRWQRRIITIVSIISFFVILLSIFTLRLYFNLRKANKRLHELVTSVNEKNEEITAQSMKLAQANAEIQHMNEHLEEMVNEKTMEVKIQNQKLLEYAYFNAHKVRGPIARLLGLVNIINLNPTADETKELLDKISDNANELDDVVREINRKLDHPGT